MKAPMIIATRLSKITPLTAERRRAIEAQAAVAFLDVTDAIATQFPT